MDTQKYIRLINKTHPLPKEFVPSCLVDIGLPFDIPGQNEKKLLEAKAAKAALSLINASRLEGINLYCISGYRSYHRQKQLYTGNPYVAPPGTSEHQSGLALDLSCPSVKMKLTDSFASTKEGRWLARNASLYGFILRYPQNKEQITGIPYEPWHIRYVTKPLSTYLSLTGMVLEEYHELCNYCSI